jgi:hypothetical protein
MTIILRPEQEQLLLQAINSGFARSTDEALDQALDGLRNRLPKLAVAEESTATVARRLAGLVNATGCRWVDQRSRNCSMRAGLDPVLR